MAEERAIESAEAVPTGIPLLARFRRRFIRRLLRALGRGHGAHRVALAFAVGVSVGLSPLFGLHVVLALILAVVLRLDKLDVILGSLILNPLTVVPIYSAATAVGMFFLGNPSAQHAALPWDQMNSLAFWRLHGYAALGPYLQAFILGSLLFSMVGGLTTYQLIRQSLEAIDRRRDRRREERRRSRSSG